MRRTARNFNDKIRRLLAKNPDNRNILPQFFNEKTQQFESRITVDYLKKSIQTRQDYNRMVNMLKRFSKRGAERVVSAPGNEYGSKITRWQKAEMIRMQGIVNRKRRERLSLLKTVEVMNVGGKLGYTLGEMFGMGLASRNQLTPQHAFTPSQSQTDIKYKARVLIGESASQYYAYRDELLRTNFISTLKQNFNESDIKDIIDAINAMDHEAFVIKFEAKVDSFEFAYPPARGSEEYKNYVSALRGYWVGGQTTLD